MYTAMHYMGTTANQRRTITNELELIEKLNNTFYTKYDACVRFVHLDQLSYREQFRVFATAKIVIAQHGAGLTFSGFMPNATSHNVNHLPASIVVELLPHVNPTFQHVCNATGVTHIMASEHSHPDIYRLVNGSNIEVNPNKMVRLVSQLLEDWEPPVYDPLIDELHVTDHSDSTTTDITASPHEIPTPPTSAAKEVDEATVKPCNNFMIPEVGYIRDMLTLEPLLPFVWKDSGFDGFPGYPANPYARKSRKYWQNVMNR
jgi:hypothetical protein